MSHHPKTAMILAAGLGTRLGSLTASKPKALVEVHGRSLLEINLRKLERLGYEQVIINTHHHHGQIEAFVRNFDSGLRISLSHEPGQPLETGGGLLKALPLVPENNHLLLHNVDIITDLDVNALHDTLIKRGAAAALAVSKRETSRMLLFDKDDCLAGWINLQTGEQLSVKNRQPVKTFAFSGISCIDPVFLAGRPVERISLVQLLLNMADAHNIVAVKAEASYWFDLGKATQLAGIEAALKNINF
ncbi:MAG: NTP transferase domain-containing protein [Bacteroidetes bacterium]|nr:NTP transferase domain-containing protein [Bacteroidota bacterium]